MRVVAGREDNAILRVDGTPEHSLLCGEIIIRGDGEYVCIDRYNRTLVFDVDIDVAPCGRRLPARVRRRDSILPTTVPSFASMTVAFGML